MHTADYSVNSIHCTLNSIQCTVCTEYWTNVLIIAPLPLPLPLQCGLHRERWASWNSLVKCSLCLCPVVQSRPQNLAINILRLVWFPLHHLVKPNCHSFSRWTNPRLQKSINSAAVSCTMTRLDINAAFEGSLEDFAFPHFCLNWMGSAKEKFNIWK